MNLERIFIATTTLGCTAVLVTCVVGMMRLGYGPVATPIVAGVVVIDVCAVSAAFVYRRMLRATDANHSPSLLFSA